MTNGNEQKSETTSQLIEGFSSCLSNEFSLALFQIFQLTSQKVRTPAKIIHAEPMLNANQGMRMWSACVPLAMKEIPGSLARKLAHPHSAE